MMGILTVLSILITIKSVLCLLGDDDMELIQTPYGLIPRKCIIRHSESPVEITELTDGVSAFYPKINKTIFFPLDQDCVDNANKLFQKESLKDITTEGWDDFVSFTTPHVGNFTATYSIPNESPPNNKQVLYFFIGFQNNDDDKTMPISIVQPLVNYDLTGFFPEGWSMEPGVCCPSGQPHYGPSVVMTPGESAKAWIYAEGEGKDIVIGQSKIDGSNETVLTVKDNNRTFNWACAALEDYRADCAQTNGLPFNFTNMVITSLNGSNVDLKWKKTEDIYCDGGVVITNNGTSVSIYGHGKPNSTNT